MQCRLGWLLLPRVLQLTGRLGKGYFPLPEVLYVLSIIVCVNECVGQQGELSVTEHNSSVSSL